jgi:hypothetical protein
MRTLIIVIVIVFGISKSSIGSHYYINAPTRNRITFFLNSGISLPQSPGGFRNCWRPGFALGCGINIPLNDNFLFFPSLQYNGFGLDKASYFGYYTVDAKGGTASILTIMADMKGILAKRHAFFRPYLLTGIGIFHFGVSDITLNYQGHRYIYKTKSVRKPCFNFGLGFEYALGNKSTIFTDFNLLSDFGESPRTEFIPIRIGINFR